MVRGIPKLFTKSSDRSGSIITNGGSRSSAGTRQNYFPSSSSYFVPHYADDDNTIGDNTVQSEDTYTKKKKKKKKSKSILRNSNKSRGGRSQRHSVGRSTTNSNSVVDNNNIRSVSWSNTFDTYEEHHHHGEQRYEDDEQVYDETTVDNNETFETLDTYEQRQDMNLIRDFNFIYPGETDMSYEQSTFETYEYDDGEYTTGGDDYTRDSPSRNDSSTLRTRTSSSSSKDGGCSTLLSKSSSEFEGEIQMEMEINVPRNSTSSMMRPKIPAPQLMMTTSEQQQQQPPPPPSSGVTQVERKQMVGGGGGGGSVMTRSSNLPPGPPTTMVAPRQVERKQLSSSAQPQPVQPQVEFRNLACASTLSEATIEAMRDRYGNLGFDDEEGDEGDSFMNDMNVFIPQLQQKMELPPHVIEHVESIDTLGSHNLSMDEMTIDNLLDNTNTSSFDIRRAASDDTLESYVKKKTVKTEEDDESNMNNQKVVDTNVGHIGLILPFWSMKKKKKIITNPFFSTSTNDDEKKSMFDNVKKDLLKGISTFNKNKTSFSSGSTSSKSSSEKSEKSQGKKNSTRSKSSQDEESVSVMTEITGGGENTASSGQQQQQNPPNKSVSFGGDVVKESEASYDLNLSLQKSASFYDDEEKEVAVGGNSEEKKLGNVTDIDKKKGEEDDVAPSSDASNEVNSNAQLENEDKSGDKNLAGANDDDNVPVGDDTSLQDVKKSNKKKQGTKEKKEKKQTKKNKKKGGTASLPNQVVVMDQSITDLLDRQSTSQNSKSQQQEGYNKVSDKFQPTLLPPKVWEYDDAMSCGGDSCVTTESILSDLKVIEDTAKMMYQQLVLGDATEQGQNSISALFSPTETELVLEAKGRGDHNDTMLGEAGGKEDKNVLVQRKTKKKSGGLLRGRFKGKFFGKKRRFGPLFGVSAAWTPPDV